MYAHNTKKLKSCVYYIERIIENYKFKDKLCGPSHYNFCK